MTREAPSREGRAAGVRVLARAELGDWAEAWDELVLDAALPSPFLRSWWLGTVPARPLLLLVVDAQQRLLGGLALEVEGRYPVRRLSVAGGGVLTPDHLDLVTRRTPGDPVVGALAQWWRVQRRTVVDLRGLREHTRLAEVFGPGAVELDDVAPYEPLTSFEAWLAGRTGSFRKRLRRLERQAERAGVVFREVADDEVGAALDAFTRMHAVRADRTQLSRALPRLRRAVEEGHRAGEVLLVVAEVDGRWGWVGIGFITAGRLSLYQSARTADPVFDGLGTLLDLALVRAGCDRGVREVDFLRGAEPYKASFVARQRRLVRVRAARGGLGGLLVLADRAARAAASVLRRR